MGQNKTATTSAQTTWEIKILCVVDSFLLLRSQALDACTPHGNKKNVAGNLQCDFRIALEKKYHEKNKSEQRMSYIYTLYPTLDYKDKCQNF